MKKKRNIMKFAGILKISEEEAEEMKLNIDRLRKRSTKELLKNLEITS